MGRLDINYRHYNRIRNMGDAVTPYVLEDLTGFAPVSVGHDTPHILGIGSTMFMATAESRIWGTGILNTKTYLPPIDGGSIYAVRGKKTYEHLVASGVALRDIPLGDPGIFAGNLVRRGRPAEKKYRAALIPHHGSINHPLFQRLRGSDEFCVINTFDQGLDPIFKIGDCEAVISQSLHGLVFAESLGVPSTWISTDPSSDWCFKFQDWFSMTENPQLKPLSFSHDLDQLIAAAETRSSTIDRVALRDALPIASVLQDHGSPVGFRTCRDITPISIFAETLFRGDVLPGWGAMKELKSAVDHALFDTLNQFYVGMAERTYLCVQPRDDLVPVTSEQLLFVCSWLDANIDFDFALIMPAGRLRGEDSVRRCGPGLLRLEGEPMFGGAIVVRPDFGGLSERAASFFV